MQQVAIGCGADTGLPAGCVPLSDVESAVRKLLECEAGRIPSIFDRKSTGEIPVSWRSRGGAADIQHIKGIWESPDRDKVLSGITSHLMERLTASGGENNQDFSPIFAGGQQMSYSELRDTLYVCDPSEAPAHCQTKIEARQFIELFVNRSFGHPFLDRKRWVINEQPRFHLVTSLWELIDVFLSWRRIRRFRGGQLGFRRSATRKDRDWKAASELAREVKTDIRRIVCPVLPRSGTPQFEELIDSLCTFFSTTQSGEAEVGYAELEDALITLGVSIDSRYNTAVRQVMKAVRETRRIKRN